MHALLTKFVRVGFFSLLPLPPSSTSLSTSFPLSLFPSLPQPLLHALWVSRIAWHSITSCSLQTALQCGSIWCGVGISHPPQPGSPCVRCYWLERGPAGIFLCTKQILYINICVYILYTNICIHINISTYMHVYTYLLYLVIEIHVNQHVSIHRYMSIHTYTLQTHTYEHTNTRKHMCTYLYTYVHIYILYIYTCKCIYMYMYIYTYV